jgi:hypothetical protein
MYNGKIKVFGIIVILIVIISFTFFSCVVDESRLIGVWESEKITLKLLERGKGTLNGNSISWEIAIYPDMTQILISPNGERSFYMQCKISGKTLTLTRDGVSFELKKK